MERQRAKTVVAGAVVGVLLGVAAISQDAITASLAYRGQEPERVFRVRGISERVDDKAFQRAKVIEKGKRPTVKEEEQAEPASVQAGYPPEACGVRVPLILDLREAVLGLIPRSQLTLTGLRENIAVVFDEALAGCVKKDTESAETESDEAKVEKKIDNRCERFGKTSRRRKNCEASQNRNEPFTGREMRSR